MRIPSLSPFGARSFGSLLLAGLLLAGSAAAEDAVRIEPAQGRLGWLTDSYRARTVPPIDLSNSSRLQSLERAGNLYLSAQDAIALAIENNLDIEVQRYGPLLANEVLKRALGGGALRSVGVGVAPGPISVSLAGVSVAGIGATGTAGQGVSSGGGIVTQLGPPIPSFDPTLHAAVELLTHHQPAKQHRADGHHRADPTKPHSSGRLYAELGLVGMTAS